MTKGQFLGFAKKKSYYAGFLLICAIYNAYFIFLLPDVKLHYLAYLDVLLAAGLLACFLFGLYRFIKEEREGKERDAAKSLEALEEELKKQFDQNCDLQDYIARWCHEAKLPLAAALLIAEQLEDSREREKLREQLERINQLLANALLGCKVQSSLFDLQIRPVRLAECVRASIHNNQFFLIQKHFEMDIRTGEEIVYTDKAWLTYVLDQLVSNAVKYAGENPRLSIRCEEVPGGSGGLPGESGGMSGGSGGLPGGSGGLPGGSGGLPGESGGGGFGERKLRLIVEDWGAGIKEEELRRVFDRGFTGSNYHNGQYRSTGMGLYMAKLITDKLGHGLSVESVYGEYTKFSISFADNREYFFAG